MNGFTESYVDFPACNHVMDIGPENIGYTNGLTWDGCPFEAEVYCYGEQKELAVIFPDIYLEEDDCEEISDDNESNVTGFKYTIKLKDFSVLPIGMVERGQETDFKVLKWYLSYIEDLGLIRFTGAMRNCAVFYYTDINGNDLVQVRTGLITNGQEDAVTDLTFRDFPNRKKCVLKLVE